MILRKCGTTIYDAFLYFIDILRDYWGIFFCIKILLGRLGLIIHGDVMAMFKRSPVDAFEVYTILLLLFQLPFCAALLEFAFLVLRY